MEHKDVVSILEAVDSWWAFGALALVGLYLLLWRYGGKILEALEANRALTEMSALQAAKASTTSAGIAASIITNHGSENMGKSMDRLTEVVWSIQAELRDQARNHADQARKTQELHELVLDVKQQTNNVADLQLLQGQRMEQYISDNEPLRLFGLIKLAENEGSHKRVDSE